MDLITAHNLMKPDNAKWFKCTYENAEKKDDSCLIEYIEEICADPEAWVKSLPANIKARSTLTKPKTALMSLTSLETPLEEQLKTDLKTNLEKTYKNKSFIDAVLKDRSPHDSDDSRSSTDVDDSMKITDLRKQVDILKRALTACCKNTDFSDTVAVLMESLPEL
jgi:hypothetical protein